MSRPRTVDFEGQRFGRLFVTGQPYKPEGSKLEHWPCKCDCGRTTIVATQNLKSGMTKSCGCLKAQHQRNVAIKSLKQWSTMDRDGF